MVFHVAVESVISRGRASGRNALPSTISFETGSGPWNGITCPMGLSARTEMPMCQVYRQKLDTYPCLVNFA